MATVASKYRVEEVVGARVGLELEIEGDNLPRDVRSVVDSEGKIIWEAKPDGSLRNGGMEYVFRRPLGSVATQEALQAFGEFMDKCGARPDYSFRTSTHCHVNVSNLELDNVKTIVALFTLFEDEYINFCARTRKANRFCLAAKDADGVVENFRRFLRSGDLPDQGRGKYSALNICTLARFGTLEFRCLEGTNDWNRIFTWVRALLALRKAGKEIGTVKALMKLSPQDVAKLVFPTERLKNQFLKDGWEERFEYNKSVAWDMFSPFMKD